MVSSIAWLGDVTLHRTIWQSTISLQTKWEVSSWEDAYKWGNVKNCHRVPEGIYPLVNCNITMENQHFYWVIQLSMAIFNIYVSLREGNHVCLPNIVFGPHPLHPAMPRQASSGEVSATMVATPLSDVLIGPMQAISHRPLAQHGIFLYIVCIVSSWYFSS